MPETQSRQRVGTYLGFSRIHFCKLASASRHSSFASVLPTEDNRLAMPFVLRTLTMAGKSVFRGADGEGSNRNNCGCWWRHVMEALPHSSMQNARPMERTSCTQLV